MAEKPVEPRDTDERALYLTLEARGLANVKADLSSSRWKTNTRDVIEWVNRKEQAVAEEAIALARRNVEAAERSAAAADRSAAEAAKSARWAMWAVIVATVALVVAAWPLIFGR